MVEYRCRPMANWNAKYCLKSLPIFDLSFLRHRQLGCKLWRSCRHAYLMHIVLTVPGAGLCRNDYISAGVSGFQACSRQLSDLQREDKASASMEQINRLQQDAIALKAKGREVHCRILRLLVSRTKKFLRNANRLQRDTEMEKMKHRLSEAEHEIMSLTDQLQATCRSEQMYIAQVRLREACI